MAQDVPRDDASDTPELDQAMAAIASMRRAAQAFGASVTAEHSATSPDGTVTAVAASSTLRTVTLDPSFVSTIGHAVEPGPLASTIAATVRRALAAGRPAVIADDAEIVAALRDVGRREVDAVAAEEFVRRTFRGEAADALVTAVVSGAGEVTELELATSATRGGALAELGPHVVHAVNAALAQYRAARAAEFGLEDAESRMAEQTDAFVQRMDGVATQMDDMRSGLVAKLAEVQALRNRRT